ncbi:hypothetical protein EVAR_7033_1 [Eumeta japonica]|uniref:Uncharacterized protein n=1 Tax=Eumeta variegata TaxID=151549 RepID=A0A4C1YPE9_EUMVA|nr:hypothetical protein EVAR_7033_1 [Eumeta japonica]
MFKLKRRWWLNTSQNNLAQAPDNLSTVRRALAQAEERVRKFMATPMGGLFLSPAALYIIVSRLPRKTIVAMNRVFNGILLTGHFSDTWKREKVITIPKAGKDPSRWWYSWTWRRPLTGCGMMASSINSWTPHCHLH